MSIKIKRYNIILKLAVALAILGCFFIANGRTVRAVTGTASNFTVTNGTLTCDVAGFATEEKLGFYFGNDKSKVIKQGITGSGSTCTVTAAEILQAAADNGLDVGTNHTFDIYYCIYTGDSPSDSDTLTNTNKQTAAIYSAEAGTSIKVEPVDDNAKVKTGVTAKAYCYAGGKVIFTYTADIPSGQRLTGWTETVGGKDVSATDSGWVGLTYTTTIKTDSSANIKIVAKSPATVKVIENLKLEPVTGSTLYFQKNPTTPETNGYTLKAKDADGNDVTVSFNEVVFSAGDGSGAFTSAYYPEATPTEFRVSSTTGTNTDIKLVATVKHGNGDGSDKAFNVVLNVYNGFDTAEGKYIEIDGSEKCGYNLTEGPYSVVSNSAGRTTGSVDIKDYLWTITPTDGGLKFLNGDGSVGGIESTLAKPSIKATAALNSQYTIKVKATDYFGNYKEATMTVTIVEPSVLLTLAPVEITNGYYVIGEMADSPVGSLSDCVATFSAVKNAAISKTFPDEWYAIIKGNKTVIDSNGTFNVTAATSNVTATVRAIAKRGNAEVTKNESDFTVYPSPKDSFYDAPSRKLTVILPSPLRLGTVNGSGSYLADDYDYEYVTGYEYTVSRDGTSLSSSTSKKANPNGVTKASYVSSSSLEKIVTDNKSKFSGDQDSMDLTLKFYGDDDQGGEDAEIIKDINGSDMEKSFEIPVYKVSIVGDSGLSSTTAYAYGLEGQNVSLSVSAKSGYKITGWSDNTSCSSSKRDDITVSSDTSKNKYTVYTSNTSSSSTSSSSTSKTSSGTGRDYDDVPTTSESNAPIWLIIFMVFAVIGSGYALYMQLKPVSAQDDSYDEEDEE